MFVFLFAKISAASFDDTCCLIVVCAIVDFVRFKNEIGDDIAPYLTFITATSRSLMIIVHVNNERTRLKKHEKYAEETIDNHIFLSMFSFGIDRADFSQISTFRCPEWRRSKADKCRR
jgi:hypothetical protein